MYSEEKVLKKLAISDYSQLTPEKMKQFMHIMKKADPFVIEKVVRLCPDFMSFFSSILEEWKNLVEKNNIFEKKAVELHERYFSVLENELSKNDLDFQQRKWILEKMSEAQEKMDKFVRRNKILDVGLLLVLVGGSVALADAMADRGGIGNGEFVQKDPDDEKYRNVFSYDDI